MSNKSSSDIFDLAERLANSFSYRVNSFVNRRRDQRNYKRYLQSEKPPLTPGYDVHKWTQIAAALSDSALLDLFKRGEALPANYGHGIDERIVEYPWLVSRLPRGSQMLLDAGSALNFKPLMMLPVLKEKTVHVLTLHPESNCFWQSGVSYEFADLRDLPFKDSYFDQIACLSTLEHVGLNTEIYTSERVESLQKGDYKIAAGELWRVLKPGGRLYLTLPFGKPCDLDWLQQFDAAMIGSLLELLRPREVSEVYYRYDARGWSVSSAEACRDAEYTAPESVSRELPVAAGAVVCLDLLK